MTRSPSRPPRRWPSRAGGGAPLDTAMRGIHQIEGLRSRSSRWRPPPRGRAQGRRGGGRAPGDADWGCARCSRRRQAAGTGVHPPPPRLPAQPSCHPECGRGHWEAGQRVQRGAQLGAVPGNCGGQKTRTKTEGAEEWSTASRKGASWLPWCGARLWGRLLLPPCPLPRLLLPPCWGPLRGDQPCRQVLT